MNGRATARPFITRSAVSLRHAPLEFPGDGGADLVVFRGEFVLGRGTHVGGVAPDRPDAVLGRLPRVPRVHVRVQGVQRVAQDLVVDPAERRVNAVAGGEDGVA